MNTPPTRIRYPTTWEANLLVAGLLTMILVFSAVAVALGLPFILILSLQILIIMPGLLWIAICRLPLRVTLRLFPSAGEKHKREVVMTSQGKFGLWVMLIAPGVVDQIARKSTE